MKISRGRESDESGFKSNNLWVGSLTTDTTEADLADLFRWFGEIDKIMPHSSRSFAFIYFRRVEEAVAAKEALQGANLKGNQIKIEYARPARPCKSLWVGGISPSVSKDDLEAEFRKFGKIEDFRFLRERRTAFFDFFEIDDAIQAKSMNGKRMGGSNLRVDFLRSQMPRKELWSGSNDGRDGNLSTKQQYHHSSGDNKGDGQPSKVLWIGYSPSVQIDEQMLHNAMILFGEIEGCISYPSRHFSLVKFRSVEEARRAKEGLQGRLFNDPRITIMYSNDDMHPELDDTGFNSGVKRSRPEMLINDPQFNSSPHSSGILGSMRPFRGSVERSHSDLEYNGVVGKEQNWRRPSPNGAGILPSPAPSMRLPIRQTPDSRERYDPAQVDRETKRTRRDGSMDVFDDRVTGLDRSYGHGSVAARPGRGFHDFNHMWRGVIAKVGTPVCHARCVPIGTGIKTELPEVINCSARTGLDILAEHYTEAIGVEIVYFLPDSEDDFVSYTEFLRYLGSKNRAGVSKLQDGTTLFLVPPSDFLTDVLNISGPERLYGVVLKLPKPPVHAVSSYRQESRGSPANVRHGMYATRENQVAFDYNRVAQEDLKPPSRSLLTPASEPVGVPNTAMPQAGVTLSRELLATLASLLPATSQPAASESHQPMLGTSTTPQSTGLSNGEALSQVWNRDQSTIADSSNLSFQQVGNQYNPAGQVPPTAPMHYLPVSSTPSYSSGMVNGGMQYQGSSVSLAQQEPLAATATPLNNYAMYSQGSYQAVSQPMSHQYQPEAHQLNQTYIPVSGAENPGLQGYQGYQQGNYHGLTNNQEHNSQTQTAMPLQTDNTIFDLSSQAQQLQPVIPGAGQGTSNGEVDKDQRYQSTLQFAANLLLQIQQRQPSDASAGQVPHNV